MDRKWTFFLSSTYEDLRVERQTIVSQILKMEEIPIGMEQFGAIDKSSWENIERFIDTADYYILLIAGRYGSYKDSPDGISYTEREYRYAKSKNIPVIAVMHGDPASLPGKMTETTEEGREKLEAFRAEVKSARLVAFYSTTAELIGEIAAAIGKAKQRFPRPGWVRNEPASNIVQKELEETRDRLDEALNTLDLLKSTRTRPEDDGLGRAGSATNVRQRLASTTAVVIRFKSEGRLHQISKTMRWRDIFIVIASKLIERDQSGASILHSPPGLAHFIMEEIAIVAEETFGRPVTEVELAPHFEDNMQVVFESLELVSKQSIIGYYLTSFGRNIYIDYRAREVFNAQHDLKRRTRASRSTTTQSSPFDD